MLSRCCLESTLSIRSFGLLASSLASRVKMVVLSFCPGVSDVLDDDKVSFGK